MNQQELPKKELALYKSMLKLFEFKQYKKGLKTAETVLKKVPEHGETLVLKGLFLSHLNRKEEGFELAKKGLKINPNSGTSWNVMGIMYRNERNYKEALKSFIEAIKFDKNNFQIIRDICYLHIHLRNYDSFNEMSQFILSARPANRAFWGGLAVSYHLVNNLDSAIKVLDAYIETFYESKNVPDYEHSELMLYRNLLYQENGQYEKAKLDLDIIEKDTFDKLSLTLYKARILKKLGDKLGASETYRKLININPDCKEYILELLDIEELNKDNLTYEDNQRVLTIFDDLRRDNPKSNLLKYLPLVYSNSEQFESYAKPYITHAIKKGIPSLFSNLKDLYKNEEKKEIIIKIIEEIYNESKNSKDLEVNGNGTSAANEIIWSEYFLAQHYDKIGDHQKALEFIELAIQREPKMVELYMTKARIYKHLKNIEVASEVMEEARKIDLADRYVNTKCTKYLLRNNKVEEAENIITLFVRPDSNDKLNELAENQCLWFEIEAAKSRYRQNQIGLTLKKAHLIAKHFNDFEDDQLDFHGYCMRKSTVRPYLRALVFEDKLYCNKTYLQAVELAAKCYVMIAENPEAAKNADNPEYAKLSAAEKKKLKLKQKKALQKSNQENEKNNELTGKNESKKDEDPKGLKYFSIQNPLEEAFKLIKPTLEFEDLTLSYVQACFEVLIRQNKFLLSLKMILKSIKLDSKDALIQEQLKKFIECFNEIKKQKKTPEYLINTVENQLKKVTVDYPEYLDIVVGLQGLEI
ncbi:N-terminal acetyltransferase A, auxiliary subunit [Neoconidiobolus thromboides FSU 785]|nr:N-terminal acetyltransferase A, auxiliary subunit [Neoconidiobolus thromboides FSU 785]